MKKIVFNIVLFLNLNTAYAAFFDHHAQGWHWYIDPTKDVLLDEKEMTNSIKPMSPTEQIKAYQQKLETALHKAMVQPSYNNIQAYQLLQKDLMDRSQNFAKVWMQVVYQNPDLDHTIKFPVNQKARHIYLDEQKQQVKNTIYNLKDQYGLFFFFSSNCAYCHEFAPIVRMFAKQYDWKLIGISLDNQAIDGFPNFLRDNGLAAKWNVTVLPSLFAVNPITGDILPVAFGLTSFEQMESRIMALSENHD